MYTQFFRLAQAPFSISPDPRYLFMSERHREALAHLLYGIDSGGGVVLLTGDIGTGKTTICRSFLEQVPPNCNVAYIFNPKLTVSELLQSVCEEFHVEAAREQHRAIGVKDYVDALNRYLLTAHAAGCNNVLIIDEAQNLSADVLEQLRLLTNLETNERKLLQIILIGQSELRTMLARPELEQLAQRVITHTHLTALSEQETASYIQHRLATAGLATASPFQPAHMKQIHRLTRGVPRRINLLCDRVLLGAYANATHDIDRVIIEQAASELFINQGSTAPVARSRRWYAVAGVLGLALAAGAAAWSIQNKGPLEMANLRWLTTMTSHLESKDVIPVAATEAQAVPDKPEPATQAPVALAQGPDASLPSPVPNTILFEQDGTFRAGMRSDKSMLRQLARNWGIALPDGDPCAVAKKAGLRCHRSSSGFAELRQLDRPAVVKLYDQANRAQYALLTALSDDRATLRVDDAVQTLTRATLTSYFRGEFVTMWRTPPGFDDTIKPGNHGPEVDWVGVQMAKLHNDIAPAAGEPFNPKTMKQVRHFQQAQGLFVDGVVGPVTLMHLNRAIGMDEPRLSKPANAASGE